jgi:hypothetical protein
VDVLQLYLPLLCALVANIRLDEVLDQFNRVLRKQVLRGFPRGHCSQKSFFNFLRQNEVFFEIQIVQCLTKVELNLRDELLVEL